jgi:hypothetical protein
MTSRPRIGAVLVLVAVLAGCSAGEPVEPPQDPSTVSSPPTRVTPPPPPRSGPGASVVLTFPVDMLGQDGTGTLDAVACRGVRGPWTGTFTLRVDLGQVGESRTLTWTFDPNGRAHIEVGDFEDMLGSGPHHGWIYVDLGLRAATGPKPAIAVEDVAVVQQGFPDRSLRSNGETPPPPTRIAFGPVAGC